MYVMLIKLYTYIIQHEKAFNNTNNIEFNVRKQICFLGNHIHVDIVPLVSVLDLIYFPIYVLIKNNKFFLKTEKNTVSVLSVFTIFVYVHLMWYFFASHFIQFLLWGLNIFSLQRTETVFFSVFKKNLLLGTSINKWWG
jgi:hypothetical protein